MKEFYKGNQLAILEPINDELIKVIFLTGHLSGTIVIIEKYLIERKSTIKI